MSCHVGSRVAGVRQLRRWPRRGFGMTLADELDDRPQACGTSRVARAGARAAGQPVLQGREDLDPLDRVDPQIGVELHVEIEHLGRISRLLGDDLDQDGGRRFARGALGAGIAVDCSAGGDCATWRRQLAVTVLVAGRDVRPSRPEQPGEACGAFVTTVSHGLARPAAPAFRLESSTARDRRCSWSSSLRKICWVFSWPSRNCRCKAAVCSANRWSATRLSCASASASDKSRLAASSRPGD